MFDSTYGNIYRGREFTIGEDIELKYPTLLDNNEEIKLMTDKIFNIKQKVNKLIEEVSVDYVDELNDINVMLGDLEMDLGN